MPTKLDTSKYGSWYTPVTVTRVPPRDLSSSEASSYNAPTSESPLTQGLLPGATTENAKEYAMYGALSEGASDTPVEARINAKEADIASTPQHITDINTVMDGDRYLSSIKAAFEESSAADYIKADTPEKKQQVVSNAKENQKLIEKASSATGVEKLIYTTVMNNNPNLTNQDRIGVEQTLLLHAAENYITKKFPEQDLAFRDSWWPKVQDFGGVTFPWREFWQLGGTKNYGGEGFFDMEKRVEAFSQLPFEKKLEMLPDILAHYDQVSNHNFNFFKGYIDGFINPNQKENPWLNYVFFGLDFVGVGGVGKGLIKAISALRKAKTPIRLLAKTGSEEIAGELNARAAADATEQTAATLDTTRLDALVDAVPFRGKQGQIYDGLTVETQAAISRTLAKSQEGLRKLIYDGGNTWIERSALTSAEQDAAIAKYTEQFAGNAVVTERTPQGFKVQVRTYKPATPFRGEMTQLEDRTVHYTYHDDGTFDSIEYSGASQYVNSPQVFINQMFPEAVQDATLINQTQSRILGVLNTSIKDAYATVNRQAHKRINAVLLQGDANKVARYSTIDLFNGVMTKDGLVRLRTAEEVAAYHATRDAYDTMFLMQNRLTRRQLIFENYKSLYINDVPYFFKADSGLKSVPKGVTEIWDNTTGRVYKVGDPEILARRLQGEEVGLVKLKYPYEAKGKKYEYVLANWKDARNIPDRVLQYRPGYVPRIWKNVNFVAVEIGDDIVNGVATRSSTVRRFFDSETEAKQYKALVERENPKTKVELRPGKEYLDLNPSKREDYEQSIFGGLYVGQRAEGEVKMGLAGTPLEHIGATQALEANMTHIAHLMPINEWRMGMIRRFLNSAKNADGESVLAKPWDWRSEINQAKLAKTDKRYDGLNAMRTWMEDQFRIPTKEERMWEGVAFKFARLLDNESMIHIKPVNALRKKILSGANVDMAAKLRQVSFHALLGVFNPRQLYTQAMGFTAAFSINPTLAAKILPKGLGMRIAMTSEDPALWRRVAQAGGLNADDFVNMMQAYKKSGIRDSVLNSADYQAAIHGFTNARLGMINFFDKGLVFFREGELFQRTYGWLQAYETKIVQKGITGPLTDAQMDMVSKEALRLTQNYTRANRAFWQKGVLSIPAQFQQVTTKYIENLVYSGKAGTWTPAEKAKVAVGQALFFGTASIPFGTWGVKELQAYLRDKGEYSPGLEDPDKVALLTGGLAEFAVGHAVGHPVSLSENLSYSGNLQQFIERIASLDTTAGKVASAAVGSIGTRTARAMSMIIPMFAAPDALAPQFVYDNSMDAISEVLSITSTWSNFNKARLIWQSHSIQDQKNGVITKLPDGQELPVAVAQGLGIPPKDADTLYELRAYNTNVDQETKEAVDAIVALQQRYYSAPERMNPTNMDRLANQMRFITSGMSDEQREKVMEGVVKRYDDKEGALLKEFKKAIDNVLMTQKSTGELELNPEYDSEEW